MIRKQATIPYPNVSNIFFKIKYQGVCYYNTTT